MTPFGTLVNMVRMLQAGTHRLEVLAVKRAALAAAFDTTIVDIDAAHMAGESVAGLIQRAGRLDRLIALIDKRSLVIVRALHAQLADQHDAS